jgi:hypothetical protein
MTPEDSWNTLENLSADVAKLPGVKQGTAAYMKVQVIIR